MSGFLVEILGCHDRAWLGERQALGNYFWKDSRDWRTVSKVNQLDEGFPCKHWRRSDWFLSFVETTIDGARTKDDRKGASLAKIIVRTW